MHGTDFANCACIERGCGDFIEIALFAPDNREAVRGGSIRVPCNREAMAIRPIPVYGKKPE